MRDCTGDPLKHEMVVKGKGPTIVPDPRLPDSAIRQVDVVFHAVDLDLAIAQPGGMTFCPGRITFISGVAWN